ncbi:MAG: prolyl-tRNA synthetase associated domain-containing protein [Rhodospirillales bacterium]|jgi:Ala-tRNA(Pro) deacylase|nr:prolyl-tRNA synthetase associated domain-containing protein [Rhodospirillales bacterium]
MPARPDDLFARLAELGIATATHRHPPVFTVEEAKRLRGDIPGLHCKNLLLVDHRGRLWLVVAREDTPLDLKALRGRLDCGRLSFAKPERLREALGVGPGEVTPFALINDAGRAVGVALERAMMEAAGPLNFHPLTNAATTSIAPDGLLAFIRAGGHEPLIVDL